MITLLGVVYNVFEAVDVVGLIRGGVYDDLGLTVGEVLKKRSPVSYPLPLQLTSAHVRRRISLASTPVH